MTESNGLGRRAALTGGATVALAGLAGCLGLGGGRNNEPILSDEPEYTGWMDGSNGYTSTVDHRGQSSTSVEVGATSGFGGFFQRAFSPAAIAISPGTTLEWRWIGDIEHNVVSQDGDGYESQLHEGGGATFSHTFETPGVHTYFCAPHLDEGMRGAVFVTEVGQ